MREVDKIRKVIDFDPWYRFPSLPVARQPCDLRGISFNDAVTAYAALNARDSGHGGSFRIDMTVHAGNTVITRMDLMAEGERLLRASVGKVENIYIITCDKCYDADKAVYQELFHAGQGYTPLYALLT